MLITRIQAEPVAQQIMACGSPQRGWSIFVQHYSEAKEVERDRLNAEWNDLRQGED